MTARHCFGLLETYIHFKDGGGAQRVEVDEEFWPQLGNRTELHDGRLMGIIRMSAPAPTWEMHPSGDEFLYLVKGSAEVIIQDINGERVVELKASEGCLVPRGLWHRLTIRKPAQVLFITPGKGTQNRPAVEE